MNKTAKIAISLPESLLQGIERERTARGETRSQFVRQAVEAYLRRERERKDIEQYIRGYQQYPETPEEVAWAEFASQSALEESPWEDTDQS